MSEILQTLKSGGGENSTGAALFAAVERIGCELAVLEAILEVESGQKDFDAQGRLIILTEKHVFWRELPKHLRARARARGLATPKWRKANYKGLGGSGSDKRWDRLGKMVALDETAGLRSASYGGPQIMGFNHLLCGYATVGEFVLALASSGDKQDEAFIRFLEKSGLADELRAKDFRAIARRYNGPGQVSHYAALMQAAYERIAKGGATKFNERGRMLRLGSDGYRVKALQERLITLGYHLQADGDFGPATRRQVVAFQVDHGLKPDGIVGPLTEERIDEAVPINASKIDGRTNLTVSDLRKRGSQTIKSADRLQQGAGVAIVSGAVGKAVENADQITGIAALQGFSETVLSVRAAIEPILGLVASNKWLAFAAIGIGVWVVAGRIKQRRLHDAKEWRHVG